MWRGALAYGQATAARTVLKADGSTGGAASLWDPGDAGDRGQCRQGPWVAGGAPRLGPRGWPAPPPAADGGAAPRPHAADRNLTGRRFRLPGDPPPEGST